MVKTDTFAEMFINVHCPCKYEKKEKKKTEPNKVKVK